MDGDYVFFSYKHPFLNLENINASVMSSVLHLATRMRATPRVQYFVEDSMEDIWDPTVDFDSSRHTFITHFHHLTIGPILNEFGLYKGDGVKMVVHNFSI